MAYDKKETIELLKPYFERGWSIRKACAISGLCDDQTVLNWIEEDKTIRWKIEAWQNLISDAAADVWKNRIIETGDYQASKDWLERKEKNDFSIRTEQTGANGKDLIPTPILGGKSQDE
jgi:hypothetical protein